MKAKTQIKAMVLAVAGTIGAPLYAADAAPVTGEVTAKVYAFDYFKGSDTNTQFLERYNTQQRLNGGSYRAGGYLDFDLHLVRNDGQRNFLVLERQGFGAHNHRGTLKVDSDTLGFSGYYSHFRTATHGLNFLYNAGSGVAGGTDPRYSGNVFPPALVANNNTGYVAQFNNDTPGVSRFNVDRSTYGMSLALKPNLFGTATAAAVDYNGYSRDGSRFASWILGNGDVSGVGNTSSRVMERWRGFEKPIDEKMNRFTFNLNGAPGGFNIAYDGSIEKFDNKARTFVTNDFAAAIQTLASGAASGAVIDPAILQRSIHFIPDSTLISNNLRFAKNYGTTAVAAGYGLSVLEQDSFSAEQQAAGYTSGKITTNSAYLNITSSAISGVGLEGFAKYNSRKNGSTFPAVGVINPANGESLLARINSIKTFSYGLAATFRPAVWKSSVTAGWQRDDKDRSLTWSDPAVPSIQPFESFYREATRSDELYVKWVARPMPGMILRVTPAYVNASQTGLVSEPERAVSVKSKLSYTAKNGMMASGYYNYRNAKNADIAFTDSVNQFATPAATSTKQDVERKQQAAGVSLNLPVSEWINTSASLSWLQDDFSSYFLRSNVRRYANTAGAGVTLVNLGRSNYDIDTYVLTLGGDWQVNDELRWNGSYTWSKSKGNTASGEAFTQLSTNNTIDGTINSAVHSLALGVDYELKKNVKLKGSYVYEYNKDASYTALTGGYHTLMLGVGFGF